VTDAPPPFRYAEPPPAQDFANANATDTPAQDFADAIRAGKEDAEP